MIESVRPNDSPKGPSQTLPPQGGDDDDDPFERAAADFTRRVRAGEHPTVDEYADRYPEIADLLRELLPTVAAVERAKGDTKDADRMAASLARPPERLGDFRIVREIGRGGMGIVYEAVQESLGRNVAVKVLPPHVTADERRVRRFDEEAKHAARLHHTNIVPVFGVGAEEGLYYYVMQLIDGEGLDRVVARRDGRRMPPREVAKIGRDVARALDCAHSQGTLHRDVKPANILVDRQGEVWITDFGLAQALEADTGSTQAHLAGTLNYMPPERFHGISEPRGDVYSLGVTLYELACGRTPFAAKSSVELMRRITSEATPPMRTVGADVPRDLETIIAKATAREPAGRYATAGEMADDLERFLDGSPIRARRVSYVERAWRWCARNRVAAAALFTAVASLVSLSIVSAVGYWRTSRLNDDLARALDGERSARTTAQTTSATALEALDRVFARFAPSSSLAVSFGDADGEGDEGGPEMGAVPAVSPQIATALEELIPYYERLAGARGEDATVERQAASALHRIGLIHARLGRFSQAREAWTKADEVIGRLLAAEKAGAGGGEVARMAAEIACDLGDVRRLEDQRPEARADYLRAIALVDADEGVKAADAGAESPATFEIRRQRARAHLALGSRDGRGRAPRDEHHGGGEPGMGPGPPRNGPPGFGPPRMGPPGQGPRGDGRPGQGQPGQGPPGQRPPGEGRTGRGPLDEPSFEEQLFDEASFDGAAPEEESAPSAPPPAAASSPDGSPTDRPTEAGQPDGPRPNGPRPPPPPPRGPHGRPPPGGPPMGGPPHGGPHGGPPPPPLGEEGRRGGPGRPPFEDEPDRQEHLEKAHAQLVKLTAERPGDPVTRLLSARCYRQRAKDNPPGKAEWESDDFRQSTELLRGLCEEYPAVPDFAYELTEALGDFHVEGLTPDDDQIATTQLREAIAISDKLIAAHPQTTAYLASNVHLHNRLAAIEGRRGRKNEEEQAIRKAFELQQRLTAQFPDSSQQAEWEGRIALKFSETLLRLGRREEAATALQTAVDNVKKFLAGADAPPNSTAEMARELERRLAELRPAGKTE